MDVCQLPTGRVSNVPSTKGRYRGRKAADRRSHRVRAYDSHDVKRPVVLDGPDDGFFRQARSPLHAECRGLRYNRGRVLGTVSVDSFEELPNSGIERLGVVDVEHMRRCRDRLYRRVGNLCRELRGVMLEERKTVITV